MGKWVLADAALFSDPSSCAFLRHGVARTEHGSFDNTPAGGGPNPKLTRIVIWCRLPKGLKGSVVKPQQKQARVEYFEALCRQRGLSRTVQRRTIFEALLDREDHPTADQVYELVKDRIPGVSLTTVYRVLDRLVEIGVISKLCHAGATVRFDPKMHQHHHLVCVQCERIVDLEDEKLNALALPNVNMQGFEIQEFHIHLRGICPECLRKGSRKGAASCPRQKRRARSPVRRRSKRP